MLRFQDILSFYIFNHFMIYQIYDIIMKGSTWDGKFLNRSFEPQLIKLPN